MKRITLFFLIIVLASSILAKHMRIQKTNNTEISVSISEIESITFRVFADTVATPTFNPHGGFYNTPLLVEILCATENTTIRYSTDGSDPTEAHPEYTVHIEISESTILKARAWRVGWIESEIAEAVYTIEEVIPGEMVYIQGTEGVTFDPGGLGYFNPVNWNGTPTNYYVSLSSYYIGKYAVTQAEYLAVMGINPGSHNSQHGDPLDHPINNVSWFKTIEYCNRLSMMEDLTPVYSYSTYGTNPDDWPPGWNTVVANHTNITCDWDANGYRLPTEMEWEFAARGGVTAQNAETFSYTYAGTDVAGTGPGQLGDYAWYSANAGNPLPGGSSHPDYGVHPVGTKLSNELGLYDMSGNLFDWVWDIYSGYPTGSYTNPTGPVSGTKRNYRGGSWNNTAFFCTISLRDQFYATDTLYFIGFRVCKNAP